MQLQRIKHLCCVICAYECDRAFSEFIQTAIFVVHYRAIRIARKPKNHYGRYRLTLKKNTFGMTIFTNSIKPQLLLILPPRCPQDAHTWSKINSAHQMWSSNKWFQRMSYFIQGLNCININIFFHLTIGN